jgi:hypothetical protein
VVPYGPRVWAPQHWGSWLELEAPHALYAVDSRIEIFPTSVWEEYDVVQAASNLRLVTPAPWETILANHAVAFVVTEAGVDSRLDAALGGVHGWTRVYTDADGSIWQLTGAENVSP